MLLGLIPLLYILVNCVGEVNPAGCSEKNEFTCASGQCIDKTLLCDGSSDCYDETDETSGTCVSFKCPANSFRCSYGACIDIAKKCDGDDDCRDWSDEDENLCIKGCPFPEKPQDGNYTVVKCIPGDHNPNCQKKPKSRVQQGTVIQFSCSDGFILTGHGKTSVCGKNDKWNPRPAECRKLCQSKSDPVDVKCSFNRRLVNCPQLITPGTKMTAHCKPNYHSTSFTEKECLLNGTWSNQLHCRPDCGIKNTAIPLIAYGSEAGSEYPWHAGLYRNSGEEYICGGTIITSKAILTAAHCVYSEALKNIISLDDFRVAVGKNKRNYHEEPDAQRFKVMKIIVEDKYQGYSNRYDQDIAVIALSTTIIISAVVMPICINLQNVYHLKGLTATDNGTVVGWGKTESNITSDTLKVTNLPYYDFEKCRKQVQASFHHYITSDKFCAGLYNGTHLGQGDSGGGLVFPAKVNNKKLHFLYGIVSVTNSEDPSITVFTDVSIHFKWIEKMLKNIK